MGTQSGEVIETFASGAIRQATVAGQKGRPVRFDLISPIGLRRLAETMAEGSAKYGDHNWEKGIPVQNLLNHALAHIYEYLGGDRSEDHLAHASFGLFAVMHFEEERMNLAVDQVVVTVNGVEVK